MLRGVTLFDFMVAGPWYDPVLEDHLAGWAWLQMTGAHYFAFMY